MEYKIASEESLQALENRVNELLEDRWEPQGGLSVTLVKMNTGYAWTFAQALTRRSTPQD